MKFGPTIIHTIDTHTGGDPTRIVVSGLPLVLGNTMLEKKQYLIDNLDHIRTSLMLEPRGHKDMFGAVLLEPTSSEADVGVVFMSNSGYLNMCGHGTIGVATAIIESGIISYNTNKPVILETPAGLVNITPTMIGNKVTNVSLQNVPAFLLKEDVEIEVPSVGKIKVDISFGGSFFAFVNADEAGISLAPSNQEYLSKLGLEILDEVNRSIQVEHPIEKSINKVELILFITDSDTKDVNTKNVAIFGEGQVARSACGTGLSAQMATQSGKNKLKTDEHFATESVINTPFLGRIVKETNVGNLSAIIPEVNGNAYITGKHEFILHPEDELKNGFLLK